MSGIKLYILNLFLLVAGNVILCACSASKFLDEGESFYTGAEIKFEKQGKITGEKSLRAKLETQIAIEPNATFLGSRPAVWFYFIAGEPKKEKGFRHWIKTRLGQPPVFISDADPPRTANVLQGTLFNNGYFDAEVDESVVTKNKESKVVYTASLYPPFRLREIYYPKPRDSIYRALVDEIKEGSSLAPGHRYNLDRFQSERVRIERLLENKGLYYFDDRFIMFEADTTVGNREVDVWLKLADGIPDKAKRIYRFDRIFVLPDFSIATDTVTAQADTTWANGYYFVRSGSDIRPEILANVINIHRGDIYTRQAHDYTLSHLMNLGMFKFVNIKYEESSRDSTSLNAYIYLTPLLKKSIRARAEIVSKSNNFVGPGVSVSFTNRNFLGSAERFELIVNSAYEAQINRRQTGYLNSFEMKVESSLSIPRLVSPVRINYYSSRYIPNTRFRLMFNMQRRINFFQLNSFNAAYGYTWRETTSRHHELNLIDINYVRLTKTSPTFNDLLERNVVLSNSFQNQFIIGTNYSYTVNTPLRSADDVLPFDNTSVNRHNFYFNANVNVAGNVIHFLQNQLREGEGPYELFGAPYSQFVLGDVDFRHYWQLDKQNKLVSRLVMAAGYPVGNSSTLPYIKQFAIGGVNSIRAFPARSVGPGTYNVFDDTTVNSGNNFFVDQRGDLKLEANLEYRFDIFKALEGAVFADAGNIWLWQADTARSGGEFKTETFLRQLAVGTGVGLRYDFNFFILRFDVAFPVRKPYFPQGDRWVLDKIDFGSATWRRENLVYNIAIGYPF